MRIKPIFKKIIGCFFALASLQQALAQPLACQLNKSSKITAPIYNSPENLRSDTFNVLKYTINLEIGDVSNPVLKGNTQIRFAPKLNNRLFIRFDLLKLFIDSVKENNSLRTYTYNDTILKINFAAAKNTIDTSVFIIYYHGTPQIDGTGWGGFYFDNTQNAQYAYNLGVGFGAKPHNYGRVWFPCFDNFVERSKYEFNITSDTARRAYCNGQLISDVVTGLNRTRKWILNEEIPTYLASVALANYTKVNWTVNTLTGIKPITLVAVASDTSAMKAGFVNLKSCINGFENYFGPYNWNRFGYCLVPFNSGAMEHATNISYPRAFIGNLTYESDLMAHELSHHWWGDLITCETQEDMWINEGMATFSSYMFLEWQYGKTTYLNKVKSVHDDLLHFLHKKEGGFRAISGIPHSVTYGDHVYKKGADVAHTLRGYMGDTDFFNACKYTMQQNALKSINSIELRNLFQTSSGQNLTDFFNNWIFAGGWSHFAVDSVKYFQSPPGSFNAVVSIKQKLFGASGLHNNVPLELTFFKNDWTKFVKQIVMSGATTQFTIAVPFSPIYCALNYDNKISDATSHEVKTIKAAGNLSFSLGKVFMAVQNKGLDSSLVRVIHNYVKPDPFKNNTKNHKLSNQHFWKVEGILSSGFASKIRFNYDGTKALSGTYAYMDTLLTISNGDSVGLFYRKNAADDWVWLRYANKVKSGAKTGFIELDSMMLGEYSFGNVSDTSQVGIRLNKTNSYEITIYPNPGKSKIFIEFNEPSVSKAKLFVFDVSGKKVLSKDLRFSKNELDMSSLVPGTYFIEVMNEKGISPRQKILLE